MKKIIYVVIAAIAGLFIWKCIKFKEYNSNVVSEIRLPEVDFPDNPKLKKQLAEMIPDKNEDPRDNPIYFIELLYPVDLYDRDPESPLNIWIAWYKSTPFIELNECLGYLTIGKATFIIIEGSNITLQIVSPGKSWKTFKSQPAYPLFGKNIAQYKEYVIEADKFSLTKNSGPFKFDYQISKELYDSIMAADSAETEKILNDTSIYIME